MKKITSYIVLLIFISAFLTSGELYAGSPSGPDTPPPPVGLPIDGGVFLLLISGLLMGVFNIKGRKEK